jgi:hypothetical protein
MEPELESLTDYAEDGVDLTLIRWMLSLTPGERLDFHESHINEIQEIRDYMASKPRAVGAGAE